MIPSDNIRGRFDFIPHRSTLSQQETNHTSLLFFACLQFQCWTNTIYTTLTSRALKKQLSEHVRFHYACLLPYRWQYWYITVLPAFARIVFYGVCSVFISLPLIFLLIIWTLFVILCIPKAFQFLICNYNCIFSESPVACVSFRNIKLNNIIILTDSFMALS